MDKKIQEEYIFEAVTPLKFFVRVSRSYWHYIITIKHPIMAGRENDVQHTLENPNEIRISRSDPTVYLFYSQEREKRWVCVVVKWQHENGFVITTYPTDNIKEGTIIWQK